MLALVRAGCSYRTKCTLASDNGGGFGHGGHEGLSSARHGPESPTTHEPVTGLGDVGEKEPPVDMLVEGGGVQPNFNALPNTNISDVGPRCNQPVRTRDPVAQVAIGLLSPDDTYTDDMPGEGLLLLKT
jgi:hypothetical protein